MCHVVSDGMVEAAPRPGLRKSWGGRCRMVLNSASRGSSQPRCLRFVLRFLAIIWRQSFGLDNSLISQPSAFDAA